MITKYDVIAYLVFIQLHLFNHLLDYPTLWETAFLEQLSSGKTVLWNNCLLGQLPSGETVLRDNFAATLQGNHPPRQSLSRAATPPPWSTALLGNRPLG